MHEFQYVEFPVAEKLSDFIECFWEMRANLDSGKITQEVLVPGGRAEFIFTESEVFWFGENKDSAPDKFEGPFLLGQRKAANYLGFSGTIHLFGIRLKPGCLPLFTKSHANLYSNKITLFKYIFDTYPLTADLLSMDISNSILFVENWLQSIVTNPSSDWRIIKNYIEEFSLENDHNHTISNLSDRNGWSPKQTERLFLKYAGFSPRTFMKLIRFRKVVESLSSKPENFTKAALEMGFYDQAHFIREFHNYTGNNPTSFYKYPPEIAVFLYKLTK
jgi:AraC-like DNA-binding protein